MGSNTSAEPAVEAGESLVENPTAEICTPALSVQMSDSQNVTLKYRTNGTEIIELSGKNVRPEVAKELMEFGKGLYQYSSPNENSDPIKPKFALVFTNHRGAVDNLGFVELVVERQIEPEKAESPETTPVQEEIIVKKAAPAPVQDAFESKLEALEKEGEAKTETKKEEPRKHSLSDEKYIQKIKKPQLKTSRKDIFLQKPRPKTERRKGPSGSVLSQKPSKKYRPTPENGDSQAYRNTRLSSLQLAPKPLKSHTKKRPRSKGSDPKTEAWLAFVRTLKKEQDGQSDTSLSDFSDLEEEKGLSLSSESSGDEMPQLRRTQSCRKC